MKQRYLSINAVLKKRFGKRAYKVVVDGGFSCPNKDGALSDEGCIFCDERSYHPAERLDKPQSQRSIREQLDDGMAYVRKRHGADIFIAYFQRGSNTYGPLEKLADVYNEALDHPDVAGIAISTRPDCITHALCEILQKVASQKMLWIELGLQSAHDKTLARIGRGHTVKHFMDAHAMLAKKGIPTCAHVILGLPGEAQKDMIETARFLGNNRVWGVKIHNLHVLKNTKLAIMYEEGNITLPTLEEYASLVVDFLENLPKEMVVHRVNSHSPRDITVAPEWSVNKLAIFNAVEAELERRDTWQGKKLGYQMPDARCPQNQNS